VRLFQGRYEEALEMARKEVLPDFRLLGEILANHSLGNAPSGPPARRLHAAAWRLRRLPDRGMPRWRGDKERAFEWLERAYRQRDPGLATRRPTSSSSRCTTIRAGCRS
jgi:hypothetical protein